jgi:Fe2+ transport system protein FeoA
LPSRHLSIEYDGVETQSQQKAPMSHITVPPNNPSSLKVVPLSSLRDGDRGRVHATDMHCEDCALLNAMGLTDQCEVRVCQAGEPCIVQVRTTRLGIAKSLAGKIMISMGDQG